MGPAAPARGRWPPPAATGADRHSGDGRATMVVIRDPERSVPDAREHRKHGKPPFSPALPACRLALTNKVAGLDALPLRGGPGMSLIPPCSSIAGVGDKSIRT